MGMRLMQLKRAAFAVAAQLSGQMRLLRLLTRLKRLLMAVETCPVGQIETIRTAPIAGTQTIIVLTVPPLGTTRTRREMMMRLMQLKRVAIVAVAPLGTIRTRREMMMRLMQLKRAAFAVAAQLSGQMRLMRLLMAVETCPVGQIETTRTAPVAGTQTIIVLT